MMNRKKINSLIYGLIALVVAALLIILITARTGPNPAGENFIFSVTGFAGPESVKYDPEFDVYYVSNFNGDSSGDSNAFVSRVSAEGELLELEYMVGTAERPFHGGRGMAIDGATLWVLDAEGMHRFERASGNHLDFVDFSAFELGFLNDVVLTANNDLYVTDTGTAKLYRVTNGVVTMVADTPMSANGITLNPENGRLILVPWEGSSDFYEWDVDTEEFTVLGSAPDGGNYDGVEVVKGAVISASQTDTSLHVMIDGVDRRDIDLPGRPADIGIDTTRNRVAVPYVALNRIDIFSLNSHE